MTIELLIESLVSIAAIALMVGMAWLIFKTPSPTITEELARERLAFDEPDFSPVQWLIDRDGRAALAEGADGDYALVSRLGLELVTRRYPGAVMKVADCDGVLIVAPLDPGATEISLAADDAAQWARKFQEVVAL
ncbi:hypothetical protein [Hyphococcus sp.]|uniref:hypothetical protein n=1 Tax=Hyphococcus sp. TaxID=2038636 RepID=UPI00375396DC